MISTIAMKDWVTKSFGKNIKKKGLCRRKLQDGRLKE